jgi:hypothetical protein
MSSYYIEPSLGVATGTIDEHMLIYDALTPGHHDHLKWYYNDLFQYFLYKLMTLTYGSIKISEQETQHLIRMLTELIEAKNIIEGKEF